MQKSSQWQWSMIFLSLLVISAVLIGLSFVLGANEPQSTASPSPSPTSTAQTSTEGNTPDEVSQEIGDYKVEPGESAPVLAILATLEVSEEEKSEQYDREEFRHWVNVEGNCSAREFVLREESLVAVKYSDEKECKVSTGKWLSLYDDVSLSDSSDVDIDHMVPLKEAWESGAHSWNDGKRRAYANDVEYEKSLIAVSAKSNRSKSDRDPADWLPESNAYLCTYLADWVAVKYRWQLKIDLEEKTAIEKAASDCDNLVVIPSKK